MKSPVEFVMSKNKQQQSDIGSVLPCPGFGVINQDGHGRVAARLRYS